MMARFKGYSPYPRGFKSESADTAISNSLDEEFSRSHESDITEWLRSETARRIYEKASQRLSSFQATSVDNLEAVLAAHEFLKTVPEDYTRFRFDDP